MRLTCAALILLLVLMTSAQCQQTAEDWFNKGLALGEQGKYDEAMEAFDEAISLNPNYALAWYNKGVVLDNQGKYGEAIQAYNEAIRLDPNDADAWNNKGAAVT